MKILSPTAKDVADLIEKIESSLGKKLDLIQQFNLLPNFNVSKPQKFYVYALKMGNGTVKIGIAKDVDKRADTIARSSGLKILDIYQTEPAVNARSVENAFHKTFAQFRTNGEFFKIKFQDARAELDKYTEEIDSANLAAEHKYLQDVQSAWEEYYKLETKYSLPKSDLVFIQNDAVYTTSLIVAETFEKNHFHVMRDIRKLIADLEQIGISSLDSLDSTKQKPANLQNWDVKSMFIESEYKDAKGEMRPMYYLNRDALTLLAMNFDGLKALEFKLKYIAEFNRMERLLTKKSKT